MTTTDAGRRRSGVRNRLTNLLLSSALSAAGCTTSADAAADDAPSADAPEPVAISWFAEASYTSLVADRAGTLHAVWLDRNPESQRQAIYYRATADGGRTWADPSFLSEGQPDGYTGIPSVVADGSGRVYAVWKMVDRGSSMAEQELRSTAAYGTLVYRVLEGGRWSPVRSIGAERAVVAWFATTDPRGRVHVVWSENPGGANFMSTTADAGVVKQATLDGAAARGARVVSGPSAGAGKLGYWSLSGYVDDGGAAHWVAVRGNEAERRHVLVHSAGGRERALRDYSALAQAAGARTPPQLVPDAAGAEHLVLYEGGARPRVADYAPGSDRPRAVLFTGADAEAIQDFQLSTTGGNVVATFQVTGDDGNRLADLYVSSLRGDAWTKPSRITDNASATRQQGVTDADGRSLGTVKVSSAIHASVVPDRTGALHVLLTKRETSRHVDTRAGGMSGASARSRAWFMTVPGVVSAGAGADDRRTTPTPAEPDPAPAVVQRGSSATSVAEAEQRFRQYDVTEDGWLSGTELDACRCRGDDVNRDGEVTKAEFVSAYVRRGGAPAVRASERGSTPARPAPNNAAPEVAERPAPPLARDDAGAARDGVPTGKYNCYAYGAGRPMPWEPGFGGMTEAPRATTQYVMNLTVGEGGTYQYLNRGRGSYSLDARTGMIAWRSGPFAGSGIKAAFRQRTGQRPVIYLDLEGTRASCLGPQQ